MQQLVAQLLQLLAECATHLADGNAVRRPRRRSYDIGNSLGLSDLIPEGVIAVSESGIRTRDDVARLKEAGFDAVLVGETLMRSPDKASALEGLRP